MRRAPLPIAAVLLLAGAVPVGLRADEEIQWQSGEVARVEGAVVTWEDLCEAAVEHLTPALRVPESTATSVLKRAVRERVVQHECARRGLDVTDEDIARRRAEFDAEVRRRTSGRQGLDEMLAAQVISQGAIAARIADDLRVRRLVEAGIDVVALEKEAEIRLFVATAEGPAATGGPDGVVALVDGEPIRRLALGARLLANIGAGRVRSILDAECRSRVVVAAGAQLEPEAMAAEVRHLERLRPLEERFDPEEVWETFFVHRGREERHERTSAELPESPYARSLFGLVKRFREEATEEDVRLAWRRGKDTVYGPHVLATDVEILFARPGDAAFGGAPARTRSDALRLARAWKRELEEGLTFDALLARIRSQAPEGVTIRSLRLYQTDRNRLLLDQALAIEDGEVAAPFETLSEVHVLRRESLRAAPDLEEIGTLVRERLARERARAWLEERVTDPEVVRLRWPLPLMP